MRRRRKGSNVLPGGAIDCATRLRGNKVNRARRHRRTGSGSASFIVVAHFVEIPSSNSMLLRWSEMDHSTLVSLVFVNGQPPRGFARSVMRTAGSRSPATPTAIPEPGICFDNAVHPPSRHPAPPGFALAAAFAPTVTPPPAFAKFFARGPLHHPVRNPMWSANPPTTRGGRRRPDAIQQRILEVHPV